MKTLLRCDQAQGDQQQGESCELVRGSHDETMSNERDRVSRHGLCCVKSSDRDKEVLCKTSYCIKGIQSINCQLFNESLFYGVDFHVVIVS